MAAYIPAEHSLADSSPGDYTAVAGPAPGKLPGVQIAERTAGNSFAEKGRPVSQQVDENVESWEH